MTIEGRTNKTSPIGLYCPYETGQDHQESHGNDLMWSGDLSCLVGEGSGAGGLDAC